MDRGFWTQSGQTSNGTGLGPGNTYTGFTEFDTHRSYFVFDLTGLGQRITSGTLDLEVENYFGLDPSESFEVRDYTGSIATLTSAVSGGAPYVDLGDGSLYGSGTLVPGDVASVLSIPLTAAALADINAAAGGFFALGVNATSLVPQVEQGFRFSQSSEPRIHQLILVPEPSAALLQASALFVIAALAAGRSRVIRDLIMDRAVGSSRLLPTTEVAVP
jgi:hypothetical protein